MRHPNGQPEQRDKSGRPVKPRVNSYCLEKSDKQAKWRKDMARRTLFISPQPYFQWRGSPIRVGFNAQALSELGFEVDLLTLPFGEEKNIPGVRVIRAPNIFRRSGIPIGPSFWKAMFDIILFFMALRLAFKEKYSVIHGIEDAGLIAVIAGKLTKAKIVYEKHSDPSSYKKGRIRNIIMLFYGKLEKFMARNADAIIGTGPGLADQARAAAGHGKPVYHIFDIPSSLIDADPDSTVATKEKLQKSRDDILLTYVGSFAVYQGVDLLFNSIPLVVREHPQARFIVIGGNEQEIKERKQFLEKHDCRTNVDFIGKVPPDELPVYLAASDILLSPRISGVNTPLKLLDYLKAGKPVVATELPCNRQILDESCAAFAGTDPEGFAATVIKLIDNPAARERMGKHAREKTDSLYNFKEFKNRLAECYNKLLHTSSETSGTTPDKA